MSTVFVGGSRMVSHLPAQAKERLDNIIRSGFKIIVGDANGADKAVQNHLLESNYDNVQVFCSGNRCRNNLGNWPARNIQAPKSARGFQFYATKDREMAREADFGFMLWDEKSPGTILNVLRLVKAGKKVVLLSANTNTTQTLKTASDWKSFLTNCEAGLINDLRKRATDEEWEFSTHSKQASLFEPLNIPDDSQPQEKEKTQSDGELIADINVALSSGSMIEFIDVLGALARTHSMSQVAKETGLARESLYRALSTEGNPKFTTILKVIDAVGLRLKVEKQPTETT